MRSCARHLRLLTSCLIAVVVGVYSNRVITGEHAAGYSLQLWEEKGQYFGFFLSSAGLAEDTPMGVLEDLRYDPKDRTLSFKAKLSLGVVATEGGEYVPSRDLYQFTGTLYPNQVAGNLIRLNGFQLTSTGISEDIKLYRSKKEEAELPVVPSYDAWTEIARKLLQARGPKW